MVQWGGTNAGGMAMAGEAASGLLCAPPTTSRVTGSFLEFYKESVKLLSVLSNKNIEKSVTTYFCQKEQTRYAEGVRFKATPEYFYSNERTHTSFSFFSYSFDE